MPYAVQLAMLNFIRLPCRRFVKMNNVSTNGYRMVSACTRR